MADPTRPDPSHKKLTQPGSKNFDPDPSLALTFMCLSQRDDVYVECASRDISGVPLPLKFFLFIFQGQWTLKI